jgi:hypothetical protein
MKLRTYIALSKAGHYTVTVKDQVSRRSVSQGYIDTLEKARDLVPFLLEELATELQ